MSDSNPSGRHVTVWCQHFADRPYLMLQWHDPETGKRKSKSAETCNPIEAEKKRAALEYELNHGLYREASRMPWERFRDLFTAEYFPACRPGTLLTFNVTFDNLEALCAPKTLRAVDGRMVSQFAAALRKQPGRGEGGCLSPWTVKVRLQFLRTAINWAASQKLIPECPRFPEVRAPKTKPRPVPAESFEKLLDKAPDEHWRAYLLCGWLAGLRRNEALLLAWEETQVAPWVDLSRGRIWLPAGFVKAVEDQWVPLDPDLQAVIEALPRKGPRVFHLISQRTKKPMTPCGVSSSLRGMAKAAGVRLNMKTLRKGFGSRYAGRVPAQVLQKLMRHSNISITMDYYANVDDAAEAAVKGAGRNTSRNSCPQVVPPVDAKPLPCNGSGDA